MAPILADRVRETTTTTGTGTLSLLGPLSAKFQAFDAAGSGATVPYFIEHQSANEWESGEGVITAGSPDTLTRAIVRSSSNSNNPVNFSAGTKHVFLQLSAYWLQRFGNHSTLDNLELDTHLQYHNNTRGDARYYTQTQLDIFLAAKSDTGHTHSHGTLTNLEVDNHLQYHTDARGDARYYTQSQLDAFLAGKSDTSHTHAHSDLTGLPDGDGHTQYALLAGRATPQTLAFGSASGATAGYLTSTSHATKGSYALNSAGTIVVDELNAQLVLAVGASGGIYYPLKLQTADMAAPIELGVGMSLFSGVKDDLFVVSYNLGGAAADQPIWGDSFESRFVDAAPPNGFLERHYNYTSIDRTVSYRPWSASVNLNTHDYAVEYRARLVEFYARSASVPTYAVNTALQSVIYNGQITVNDPTATGIGAYKVSVRGTPVGAVMVGVTPTGFSEGNILFYGATGAFSSYGYAFNLTGNATGTWLGLLKNSGTGAGANARLDLEVVGAAGGDPYIVYTVPGVLNWAAGVDNSDGDKWKISAAADLGTNDYFTVDTTGVVTLPSKSQWDADATAGNTRLLVWDVDAGGLRRVKVGANGTGPGGTGRALYLDDL